MVRMGTPYLNMISLDMEVENSLEYASIQPTAHKGIQWRERTAIICNQYPN